MLLIRILRRYDVGYVVVVSYCYMKMMVCSPRGGFFVFFFVFLFFVFLFLLVLTFLK